VVVHYGPPLHPDDLTLVDGIPVTSVARTLIDLAELMDADELRGCFATARERACSTSTTSLRRARESSGDRRSRRSTGLRPSSADARVRS
jgi:predicted transcriptional regulator of viral defense system